MNDLCRSPAEKIQISIQINSSVFKDHVKINGRSSNNVAFLKRSNQAIRHIAMRIVPPLVFVITLAGFVMPAFALRDAHISFCRSDSAFDAWYSAVIRYFQSVRDSAMDMTDYQLGQFGDERLAKRGACCSPAWYRERASVCAVLQVGNGGRLLDLAVFWPIHG
jgi:hypothetical protein